MQISFKLLQEQVEALATSKTIILQEATDILDTVLAQRFEASTASAALAVAQDKMARLESHADEHDAKEAALDVEESMSSDNNGLDIATKRQMLARERAKIEEQKLPINVELSGLQTQVDYRIAEIEKYRNYMQCETDAMQVEIDLLSDEVVRLQIELCNSKAPVDAVQGITEEVQFSYEASETLRVFFFVESCVEIVALIPS